MVDQEPEPSVGIEVAEAVRPIVGKVCEMHEKMEVGRIEAPHATPAIAAVVVVLEVVEEHVAVVEEVNVDELDSDLDVTMVALVVVALRHPHPCHPIH
jgi:hypothetical protein